nr:PREDICTED: toll-like receptor 2 [Struthio camelus australis]
MFLDPDLGGSMEGREQSTTPPYRLCIHERDFTPGRWIIDNIIESIEASAKVIFVLSRSFVDSEWCNYELYFAHQRAVGLGSEDVILVVKEPIDARGLPRKFSRLRKMLGSKTYLEWPPEPSRQPFFWLQLRNLLGSPRDGEAETAVNATTMDTTTVDTTTVDTTTTESITMDTTTIDTTTMENITMDPTTDTTTMESPAT